MKIDQTFWTGISAGRISPRDAITALVREGHAEPEATELVFVALGGSDLVETGADGVQRYPSGKTVADVERAMER